METLKIYPTSINESFIDRAVSTLREGGIIIYPTDTLYALGCDALNNRAIENLCRIKGIDPRRENLSIVCHDISQASEYARIDNVAFRIMRANLPGPFTMVLPAATTLPKVFKGRKTVGIRVPDNTIARTIARSPGHPVLSTSAMDAEADGDDTVMASAAALKWEGIATLAIDGGDCGMTGSTVVDMTDPHSPEILRQGLGVLI